jgi:hypothetical protein
MTRAAAVLLALVLAGGCSQGDSARRSSRADSTRFGDDRARQGDSARTVPDLALLERLVDEYEQLDVVMDELAGSAAEGQVRGKAWKGDRHEDADKARLLDLLQVEFGERYQPRTPEGAARRTDQIAALAPAAGARALTTLVLDHHRRVREAIGRALPGLRNSRVRETLEKLHQHLDDEIEQLSAAVSSSAAG